MSKMQYGLLRLSLVICTLILISGCTSRKEQVLSSPSYPDAPNRELQEIVVTANTHGKNNRRYRVHQDHSVSHVPQSKIDHSEYPEYSENPIKITIEDPVSTFSVDVDTSSYSVIRSYLKRGRTPPKRAIRTEELLNYFSYDYAFPVSKDHPFRPQVSVFDSPWSAPKQLLRIGIQGYDIKPAEQPDSNLVFLLDVSGSMQSENKLPLVKKSIGFLLKSLKPTDLISIVVYAGATGVVLEPTPVKNTLTIQRALNSLSAGGGTAGGEGLALAYAVAKENFKKDSVNRIILTTDGDFNVGQSSNDDLKKLVVANRDYGIYLSVLGFGSYNYQDDMMQAIAQNGNGTAAYIDSLQEAKKVLVDEATSSLFPIANDVKIQIEFNSSNVSEYRLLGYETRKLAREDFNNDKVDAGEIGAGHSVTAIYEITPTDAGIRSVDKLRYTIESNDVPRNIELNNELGFLKIRYKLPGETESKLISQPIHKSNESDREALFAAAVVSFSEILRGGKHMGKFNIDDTIKLARENKGNDESGYRSEFIQLAELYKLLQVGTTK